MTALKYFASTVPSTVAIIIVGGVAFIAGLFLFLNYTLEQSYGDEADCREYARHFEHDWKYSERWGCAIRKHGEWKTVRAGRHYK